MSWKACTVMSERREFVGMVESSPEVSVAEWSRRFGVSRKTAYKWLKRHREEGNAGLVDRSRRPHTSPEKTAGLVEARVVKLREQHPAWGARKLRARLEQLGVAGLPSSCTINTILHRHGLITAEASQARERWQRFEKATPNELWQMDFKGHFGMSHGGRCHPLTVLDDHSRYCLVLQACGNEQAATVKGALIVTFRKYGMPGKMLMDNGSPWGDEGGNPWTALTVWLLRLGIQVSHGRPRHPQTQGKEERFHRTLKDEVLRWQEFTDLSACALAFARWRATYNDERPHEALGWAVPASRYQASSRSYPERLPPLEYPRGDEVRKVSFSGLIRFGGRTWRIGKGFAGEYVGVRPSVIERESEVWYAGHCVGVLHEADMKATGIDRWARAARGKSAPVATLPAPTSPSS